MFKKKSGQKVDIKLSNMRQEIIGNKNQTVFFKVDFNPLKLTFLRFFWMIAGKIEHLHVF
jgi:hypothetical protein